ncbi:hypothetical protein AMAG_10049 [Allomyces macrogynus ATCC 38327]|uniref:GATA-type domain-containing protein n=1 Tax=Allomyces macrogynus (strain ATCC 38327) TaxID=578462 RepID=A0A0L0SQB5_ALLM3|nr:hypothetical protein AMAG_10049 [Allomyces macrogynus ATCC 38327]|eukprot:KNE64697.1 hypothetical protein AMAG_10049 [Allomyces macrogynus ATCC 38327]
MCNKCHHQSRRAARAASVASSVASDAPATAAVAAEVMPVPFPPQVGEGIDQLVAALHHAMDEPATVPPPSTTALMQAYPHLHLAHETRTPSPLRGMSVPPPPPPLSDVPGPLRRTHLNFAMIVWSAIAADHAQHPRRVIYSKKFALDESFHLSPADQAALVHHGVQCIAACLHRPVWQQAAHAPSLVAAANVEQALFEIRNPIATHGRPKDVHVPAMMQRYLANLMATWSEGEGEAGGQWVTRCGRVVPPILAWPVVRGRVARAGWTVMAGAGVFWAPETQAVTVAPGGMQPEVHHGGEDAMQVDHHSDGERDAHEMPQHQPHQQEIPVHMPPVATTDNPTNVAPAWMHALNFKQPVFDQNHPLNLISNNNNHSNHPIPGLAPPPAPAPAPPAAVNPPLMVTLRRAGPTVAGAAPTAHSEPVLDTPDALAASAVHHQQPVFFPPHSRQGTFPAASVPASPLMMDPRLAATVGHASYYAPYPQYDPYAPAASGHDDDDGMDLNDHDTYYEYDSPQPTPGILSPLGLQSPLMSPHPGGGGGHHTRTHTTYPQIIYPAYPFLSSAARAPPAASASASASANSNAPRCTTCHTTTASSWRTDPFSNTVHCRRCYRSVMAARVCVTCASSTASSWRRDAEGRTQCNRCNLRARRAAAATSAAASAAGQESSSTPDAPSGGKRGSSGTPRGSR